MNPEEHFIETYRSLITISTEALRTTQLLNGGAIVALLAYIGQADAPQPLAAKTSAAVTWFVVGLVAGAFAFFTSYVTQFVLLNEVIEQTRRRHMRWAWATASLAVASLLCFAVGAYCATAALAAP